MTHEDADASLGPVIKRVEALSGTELRTWLDEVLRGTTRLPRALPNEGLVEPLVRLDGRLKTLTRQDLRRAVRILLVEWKGEHPRDGDYLGHLLHFAERLDLREVGAELARRAAEPSWFKDLTPEQQQAVVRALIDLKAPVDAPFWVGIGEYDPRRFGPIVIAGLLALGFHQDAAGALESLPDDDDVAAAIWVVLDQHGRNQSPQARWDWALELERRSADCRPTIREAILSWTSQFALDAGAPANSPPTQRLREALGAKSYEPQSARLGVLEARTADR